MNDEEVLKAIKLRYKELREKTGLKQVDFANKFNLDRQQVNNWESFKSTRGVSVYTISSFCKLVEIDLREFFDSPLFGEDKKKDKSQKKKKD